MKSPFRMYIGFASMLLFAVTIAARFDNTASAPKKGARIATPETTFNFGTIKQGDVVQHVFVIKNVGTDTLLISNTQASCGCTTSMMDNKSIPPGGEGKLKAVFNSAGKMGHTVKTIYIYSNDVTDPNKTVQITADIQTEPPSVHMGTMSGAVHLEGIFEGDCASCHVDKGRGLESKQLYDNDCAICHGSAENGKPGPELHTPQMLNLSRAQLVQIITDGKSNTMMPAFGKQHNGPLTNAEIASIADYMVKVASQAGFGSNSPANK